MQEWEERILDQLDAKEKGKVEGKVETLTNFLHDFGEIPYELEERIHREKDLETLEEWIKRAAKADSLEEFQKAIEKE